MTGVIITHHTSHITLFTLSLETLVPPGAGTLLTLLSGGECLEPGSHPPHSPATSTP